MLKKAILFLITFLFLSNNYIISLTKPKNNNVGALVGRIYIELDKDWVSTWSTLPQGKHYRGDVQLINLDTNKKITAFTNLKGYYHFLNLEPGNYNINKFNFTYSDRSGSFEMDVKLEETGINVVVSHGKITAVKTVKILKEVLTSLSQIGDKRVQPMNTKFFREENFDELKKYFVKLDFQNSWKDFEWLTEFPKLDENFNKAEDFRHKKEFDKAIDFYAKALETDNNNIYAYFNRGICYYNQKKYDEAIKDFNLVININNHFSNVHNYRGDSYFYNMDYKNAIADYLIAIKLLPESTSSHRMLGRCYENLGDKEKARKYLSKAISLDIVNVSNYLSNGNNFQKNKQFDKALEEYNKVLELDNKNAIALNNIGNTYISKNDYDMAEEYLLKAIEADPKYSLAYSNLGKLNEKKGNKKKAMDYFTKSIELDDKSSSYYYQRAIMYLDENELDKALSDFNKSIENNSKYSLGYVGRSVNYYLLNNVENSLDDIEYSLNINERLTYNNFFYAFIAYKKSKEKFNAAMSILKEKVDNYDDAKWTKAVGNYLLGNITSNEFLNTESLGRNEKEKLCEFYFYSGIKNIFDNNKQEAINYYNKCIATNIFYYIEYIIAKKELEQLK